MTTGKKRANGEGSLRKRPDGRWEGRYTAGRDPVTGKAIYKNVLAKTQKAGIAENLPFHGLRHPYVKPKTKKYENFFGEYRRNTLQANGRPLLMPCWAWV